jgi:hypothetical protein
VAPMYEIFQGTQHRQHVKNENVLKGIN